MRGEIAWVSRQRAAAPKPVALAPGALVPFLGVAHRIRAAAEKGPAPVWREGDEIFVAGRTEHAARRLTDFFKREARKSFEASALAFGRQLGVHAVAHHLARHRQPLGLLLLGALPVVFLAADFRAGLRARLCRGA